MNSTSKKNKKSATQAGNALFLILIAVVLFAALSYSVVGSSRSGGDSVADDKAGLGADILMGFTAQIRQAITRMMISDQLQWWEIDFNDDPLVYTNPNCAQPRCKLFHPLGGAVARIKTLPPQVLKEGVNNSPPAIQLVSVQDIGTSAPEILLQVTKVNLAVCYEMNRRAAISSVPILTAAVPPNLITGSGYIIGGHSGTAVTLGSTAGTASAKGKDFGCACGLTGCTTVGDGRYFAVLYSQ